MHTLRNGFVIQSMFAFIIFSVKIIVGVNESNNEVSAKCMDLLQTLFQKKNLCKYFLHSPNLMKFQFYNEEFNFRGIKMN